MVSERLPPLPPLPCAYFLYFPDRLLGWGFLGLMGAKSVFFRFFVIQSFKVPS